jgi:2,4-dienoyl-CoA reductase-like NADH-dependent reductase (Old Yellow Enzyme family)
MRWMIFKSSPDSIHEFDTKVFAQLKHYGFQGSGAITRHAVWGPSALSDIAFGETAKPMEAGRYEHRCGCPLPALQFWPREGGFDGLEIDMGPESLLRQFLSPLSNHRQDEYGGSLENRMRLPLRVLEAVREKSGGRLYHRHSSLRR